MEKCVILGNELEIRQAKKLEIMEGFKCEEDDVEGIIEEYPKVELIYKGILYEIAGNEIELIINPGVYSILSNDEVVAISGKIKFNERIYIISVFEKSYGQESSVKTLEVELSTENEFDEFDEDFYDIKVKIKDTIKDYYKEVYFIEDTQNEKICIELYKMVYKNENKFRSIINKYMVITYGVNWFDKVIDKRYKDSVLSLNRWYRQQSGAEFKNVKGELYNLLIDDLIEMLKESQIEGITIADRKKYNEFFNGLTADSKLKQILEEIEVNKETVWDVNFAKYIDKDFEEIWNEYKNMRNMVAHNKLICKTVKNRIIEYSEQISDKLDNLSQSLERIYKDNERAHVNELYSQIKEEFYIEEAGGSKLPDEEDVIYEIEEDERYSTMINKIDEKLGELKDKREEASWQIEQILIHYSDEDATIEKAKLCALYLIFEMFRLEKDDFKRVCVAEIDNQCVINRFIPEMLEHLDLLKERLTNNTYFLADSFNIGKLVEYSDIYGENISISSKGMISPVKGDTDTIEVNMYVEDRLIESGVIEKGYFDYCIHEYEGYAMPEVDDYLEIRVDRLSNEIMTRLEDEISDLDDVIQSIESEFSEIIQ